jgi:hypothetical protein
MNVQQILRPVAGPTSRGFTFAALLSLSLSIALSATPSRSYAQQSTTSASLVLTVRDTDTQQPLADARIAIPEIGRAAVTDVLGTVVIGGISPGEQRVTVTLIGYESLEFTVGFEAGVTAEGDVDLAVSPFELPELVVETERTVRVPWLAMRGFYRRSEGGFPGRFLDRVEIEGMRPFATGDLFRRISGVRLVADQWGDRWLVSRRLPFQSFGSFYSNPDLPPSACPLMVLVDGIRWERSIDDIPITWIAGLEVYRGNVVPAEFSIYTPVCGLVVIWTG